MLPGDVLPRGGGHGLGGPTPPAAPGRRRRQSAPRQPHGRRVPRGPAASSPAEPCSAEPRA
eukprot:2618211-Pyramimonas_sp.AAC.1